MFKTSNKYLKPKPRDYQNLINVWVSDEKRKEIILQLTYDSPGFQLEKLKYNPVYKDVYSLIKKDKDTELEKLDKSLLWSRRFTKKHFYDFAIPFSIYSLIIIPYIFYKVLHKRILEQHVKHGYDAENLKGTGYWNLDFENKDIYPDSVIQLYFDIKSAEYTREEKKKKAEKYSEEFVSTITTGYVNDFIKRRQSLGFNDDEDDD